MGAEFDEFAICAAFSQPDNDGTFGGAFGKYLGDLSRRRRAIIFAFPPKAAGTFLRTAAITAVGGQLIRAVHAQGGRDAQFYLPIFVSYYLGKLGSRPFVTHVHMQALPANQRFIEVFDLRPVIMLRSIPDMLMSCWDMLETDDNALREGINCQIPPSFRDMPRREKADYLVDILAPWYVSYFATWLDYASRDPARVCVLHYGEFARAPEAALEAALRHSRMARSPEVCAKSIRLTWEERKQLRFNCGEAGRGKIHFAEEHLSRIRKMLSYFPATAPYLEQLAE